MANRVLPSLSLTPVTLFVKTRLKQFTISTGQDMSQSIAKAFVDARRAWNSITHYPGTQPADLASAYAIQDEALAIWARKIGGWKVGKITPPDSDLLGANRLVGPVFADTIHAADGAVPRLPIFPGGFAAAEAEFMLQLAPLDGPLPQTNAEAMQWVSQIRIGIELASSPYPGINADGPCVTVSDHGNNAAIVLGDSVDRSKWGRLDEIAVETRIDGVVVGAASTATMLDGPFGAVRFLLTNLSERGIAIQPGWWVSSGAITGVHEIASGQTADACFEGLGEVSLNIA